MGSGREHRLEGLARIPGSAARHVVELDPAEEVEAEGEGSLDRWTSERTLHSITGFPELEPAARREGIGLVAREPRAVLAAVEQDVAKSPPDLRPLRHR